jgi:hypothetical protein
VTSHTSTAGTSAARLAEAVRKTHRLTRGGVQFARKHPTRRPAKSCNDIAASRRRALSEPEASAQAAGAGCITVKEAP